jgi:hypothetical protein
MGWIKRNLIFVVGVVVALALLGAAGFYIYTSWASNSGASEKLNGIYDSLKNLQQQKPGPGNDKIDNTKIASEQQQQVRDWIVSASKYFQPIPPIPPGRPVTSESFASALRRTVDQLQHEADNYGVTLPPKYDFSFAAERMLVKFASGSLEPLAVQLGEVKTIAETIFPARINSLESIQRVRVSEDDANGPQGDYVDERSLTNNLAVVTPYVVTFRCFTPELSRVISAFASSSNAFLIKSINVQPAGAAGTAGAAGPAEGSLAMPPGGFGAMSVPGGTGQQPAAVAGKGGLQTVLKEQLLRVTLQLELVKLLPKS